MKYFLSVPLLLFCVLSAAQKKPLDHSVYDSWQSVSEVGVSDDGRYVAYVVSPQEGDGEAVICDIADGRTLTLPRASRLTFSSDSRWASFSVKPLFSDTRNAKIKKKKADQMPKDSAGFVELSSFAVSKFADVSSLKVAGDGQFALAWLTGKPKDRSLVVATPGFGTDTLKHVSEFALERHGLGIAAVHKKVKSDSLSVDAIALYSIPSMERRFLSDSKPFHASPSFDDSGSNLVFLESSDTNSSGSRHCAIVRYDGEALKEVIAQDAFCVDGWGVTQNSSPVLSKDSDRVFFDVEEILAPDDTSLHSFETAKLDIWSWDIYQTPPIQKALQKRGVRQTLKAAATDAGAVLLSANPSERVNVFGAGEAPTAIAVDRKPYLISSTWDSNDFADIYEVSLADGSRRTLNTKLDGTPFISPEGRYIVWFDSSDLCWHSFRVSDGAAFNLTAKVKGTFHDDEDDHPCPTPSIDRPHWLDGDEAFLVADKYDIFKLYPDGRKAVNLTRGAGRSHDIQYRITDIVRDTVSPALSAVGVRRTIDPAGTVYLTAFSRQTKQNGMASVGAAKPGLLSSFTACSSYPTVTKALAAETIAFRKGDSGHSADVYQTVDMFLSEKKLSAINPQQAEYNWMNVRLVHWKAYDGTALDGLLFTPEDLDASRKYPMMIYFYEKNSETLYNYRAPSPSRSTVNIPFYASRGYVVFVPDIVYKDGHPGESAYNCICSGAESMCSQFPFIEGSKMAIQGQSWGGYQTAYLVTRTGMFAAAGAGAPVGNMTSAYDGIRWESGHVRSMQYEHGQSRIGKSLWDEGGLELYIENSPVFHVENVSTPVLVMHNDADGAVPWYQGIEFFMSLRRFGHPAWLLQYNDEAHNLVERRNCKDLSIRLQQFFDHYLKGEPMPAWMKSGVPLSRKGQYFGYETF